MTDHPEEICAAEEHAASLDMGEKVPLLGITEGFCPVHDNPVVLKRLHVTFDLFP